MNSNGADFHNLVKSEMLPALEKTAAEASGFLKSAGLSSGQQSAFLRMTQRALVMKRRLGDVLDLYAVEAGWQKLSAADADLAVIVRGLVNRLETISTPKAIRFEVAAEVSACKAWVDAGRFGRILEQLFIGLTIRLPAGSRVLVGLDRRNGVAGLSLTAPPFLGPLELEVEMGRRLAEMMGGAVSRIPNHGGEDVLRFELPVDSARGPAARDGAGSGDFLERFMASDAIPSLPVVAARIISLVSREDAGVDEITATIEKDPALSARILKIVNSSVYGLSKSIISLNHAVSLLGLRVVRNLALCVTIIDTAPGDSSVQFDFQAYWQQMLTTATICRKLAEVLASDHSEDAFMIGLLQNIGGIVLGRRFPERYAALIQQAAAGRDAITGLEKEKIGASHPEIGYRLLQKWQFPESISTIVAHHHNADAAIFESGGQQRFCRIAGIAEELAVFFSTGDPRKIEAQKALLLEQFSFSAEQLDRLMAGVADEVVAIAAEFNVPVKGMRGYLELLQTANIELGKINLDYEQLTRELKNAIREKEALAAALEETNEKLNALNTRLAAKAITDGLTGLHNHQFFIDVLEKEFSRSIRHTLPLSCIMCDIDHFKRFNDTYGHRTGDLVLKKTAETIKASVRNEDLVARYGGEEFIVLLPATEGGAAQKVAERIRTTLEKAALSDQVKVGGITISAGVSTYDEKFGVTSSAELIETADQALYRAKRGGRNRVMVHGE